MSKMPCYIYGLKGYYLQIMIIKVLNALVVVNEITLYCRSLLWLQIPTLNFWVESKTIEKFANILLHHVSYWDKV